MIVTTVDDKPLSHQLSGGEAKVIFASSWGTVFERYDFYLYGLLATIISKQFFSGVNETAGFIFELLAFTAASRSVLSAHCYSERLGDLVGRKYTFLVTIVMMGISTKRRAETHSPNDCTAAISGSYERALGR